jgi:preprotein translocase subunit SecG
MLQQFILFFHLLLAFVLIGLVLIQHGKGADAGAAFGSGASGTVFGSAGSGNFLTHLTTAVACLFAITSVSLTLIANKGDRTESLSDKLQKQETTVVVPGAPVGSSGLPIEVPVTNSAPQPVAAPENSTVPESATH